MLNIWISSTSQHCAMWRPMHYNLPLAFQYLAFNILAATAIWNSSIPSILRTVPFKYDNKQVLQSKARLEFSSIFIWWYSSSISFNRKPSGEWKAFLLLWTHLQDLPVLLSQSLNKSKGVKYHGFKSFLSSFSSHFYTQDCFPSLNVFPGINW